MSVREARPNDDEGGFSVPVARDVDGAAEAQSGRREPASDEETEQDDYANTDDREA